MPGDGGVWGFLGTFIVVLTGSSASFQGVPSYPLFFIQDPTLKIKDQGLVLSSKVNSMSSFLMRVGRYEEILVFYRSRDLIGERDGFVELDLWFNSTSF